jgi:peptidoglycan/LPS O-acetylase OafA/YrhL
MKDSPNLDLLRSIAVLLVVASHLALGLGWADPRWDIEALGRVGVAVFFVHTCLVLMLSLERNGAEAVPFFVRRFFRIYPLAVCMVLFVALMRGASVSGGEVLSNLLLVQNVTGHKSILAPLWSLPYEVQMYLVLPLVFLLARRAGAKGIAALLVGGALLVCALLALGLPYRAVQYVPCFLPGVLAYTLGIRGRLHPGWLVALVLSVAAVIAPLEAAGLPELPILWALCLALGLLIPFCRPITSATLARVSRLVATYSYAIYLTHLLAIQIAFHIVPGLPSVVRWAVFAAVLALLARIAYRWIEAPCMGLGARLAAAYRARIWTARPAPMRVAASSD